MATDVERLVVSLEASITKYERAMQRAVGQTNQTARRIESRFERMNRGVSAGFVTLQRGIAAAFAGAVALRGAQQLIDASTRIENSLRVAGVEGEELGRIYDTLFESAQRNAAPIESLVELFSRATLVQNDLGASTQELTDFTDNVAVALRVAGTDAQTASGALLQLSQALGSGVVRAEEFNSIQEGALPILQAVAAGLEEAGGSVSALRNLVIDGRVSSEAFFRAFEAGSVILRDKVANAELTISQQFVRLQNVLVDTAGKFDETTGAGEALGGAIARLADEVETFGNFMERYGPSIRGFIDQIGTALDELDERSGILGDVLGFGEFTIFGYLDNLGQAIDNIAPSVEGAESAVRRFAETLLDQNSATAYDTELVAAVNRIIASLDEGQLEAVETTEALNAIGDANPQIQPAIDVFTGLIETLRIVRGEANAAGEAISAIPGTPGGRGRPGRAPGTSPVNADGSPIPLPRPAGLSGGSGVTTVSLDDYTLPTTPGAGGSGSSGGSGSGTSPAQQYQQALDAQQRRIDLLNQETAVTAQYGAAGAAAAFELERLRVQQELINAATEAGIALSPSQLAAIGQLATGMATATQQAEQLADAQQAVADTVQDFSSMAQNALGGFIQDLTSGTSAADALANALGNIGQQLLNFGLNLAFGGLGGGGGIGALFGGLFGGFSQGTANTGGARGQVRGVVHGQEAVIPLPNGGRVPVEMRGGMGGQSGPILIEISVSPTGDFDARVGQIADSRATVKVTQGIKAYDRAMPGRMRDIQDRGI